MARGHEQYYFADEEPELTDDELGGEIYGVGGRYEQDARFAKRYWQDEARIREEHEKTVGHGDPNEFNREIRPNGGSGNHNVSDDTREEPVPIG